MRGADMSVVQIIGQAMVSVLEWIGIARPRRTSEPQIAPPAPTQMTAGPAVAGFVKRIHVDRFRLAARLTSVARLNTPAGRKPWTAQRRHADLPPVPAARLGARKTRLDANKGPRVLLAARPMPQASNVIPFPGHQMAAAAPLARAA